MKRKILAIALSACLAFTMVPFAFAAEGLGSESSEGSVGAEEPQAASPIVTFEGSPASNVGLPSNQTVSLVAEGAAAYQWQILVSGTDRWVDIYGENDCELVVSSAMMGGSGVSKSYFRCAGVLGEVRAYSEPVIVNLVDPVHSEQQAQEAVAEELEPKAMLKSYGLRSMVQTYTIRIDYVFEDGETAAYSWEGTFPAGSDYDLDVPSPEVKGYVADKDRITESYKGISANATHRVTYSAAKVGYKVEYYQQNVYDDGYTRVDADTLSCEAYTNDPVDPAGNAFYKDYVGFKAREYDATTPVAADGSTVLKIYYDRIYYLMDFDLGGGYGVEPIYARYGTAVPQFEAPVRPGYSFTGWTPTVPAVVPAENSTHVAGWEVGNQVDVNLVFWYENANDDNYTCVGSASTKVAFNEGKAVRPGDFKDVSFADRDNLHFVFNEDMNSAVELKADGSTIVNVHFTRKTYRMIFFNCRQAGHESDQLSCYPSTREDALQYVAGLSDRVDAYLNPDGDGPKVWGISIYTRKWQQNVRPDWENGIANRSNTRRWMPYKVYGAAGQLIYDGTLNVSTMNVMPDADIVFWFKSTGLERCEMNYWVTPAPGESISGKTTKTVDGVTYVLRDQVVTMMGGITENEEYVDIEGFTKVYTWGELYDKGYRTGVSDEWATAHFFYKRNSYDLTYISNGATDRTAKVEFESKLSTAENHDVEPAYPTNLEPGAYEFAGWFTAENCASGTEVDWSSARMPVGGASVYAKWAPVVHTVKTHLVEGGQELGSYSAVYGTLLANAPSDPAREGYSFISWFYRDENGAEVPFSFDMPIKRDLELYAKWRQEAVVDGTLYYKLKDSETAVAEPSAIQATVGDTKTYEAKAGDSLLAAYQQHYFPVERSVSVTFDIDPSKNTGTFEYERRDEMSYTVKYLEKGTGRVLAPEKTVATTTAYVVETFLPIPGYLPDVYRKHLVVSIGGPNEITFWYTEDGDHAPVLKGHYLQEVEGDGYVTYKEVSDGYGTIGEVYEEGVLSFTGFALNVEKSETDEAALADGGDKLFGTLDRSGLELKLYYDRIEYPYAFRFVDEGGKEIRPAVTGDAKYEATVSCQALVIPGYELVSDNETETIAIGVESEGNVAEFVYKAVYADLKISKSGQVPASDDQTFLFRVVGEPYDAALAPIDMVVAVRGAGSVVVEDLPVGDYAVTEVADWSWRYSPADGSVEVELSDPDTMKEAAFENDRTNPYWLSGDSYADNRWGASALQR